MSCALSLRVIAAPFDRVGAFKVTPRLLHRAHDARANRIKSWYSLNCLSKLNNDLEITKNPNIEPQEQKGKVDEAFKEPHQPFVSTSISAAVFLIAFTHEQRQNLRSGNSYLFSFNSCLREVL